jgi:integrase
MTGIYSGLRIPSEVVNLRWEDVDLRRGLLTVQGAFAKNGKTETVPLTSKLREALGRLKAKSRTESEPASEYVFTTRDGKPYKTVKTIFETACRRAGLGPDITPPRHAPHFWLAARNVGTALIQFQGLLTATPVTPDKPAAVTN